MSKRKYQDSDFVPCSAKHKHCSPAHAALVRGYRDERWRQEVENESILNNPGDLKHAKENGFRLINFKDWLIANKGKNKCESKQDTQFSVSSRIAEKKSISTTNASAGTTSARRAPSTVSVTVPQKPDRRVNGEHDESNRRLLRSRSAVHT